MTPASALAAPLLSLLRAPEAAPAVGCVMMPLLPTIAVLVFVTKGAAELPATSAGVGPVLLPFSLLTRAYEVSEQTTASAP